MTNLNQAYKDRIADVFSRGAGGYGQIGPLIFNHFGRRLVNHAGIWEGTHVLDIACGRGSVLYPVSEKVGASGQVVGIDIAEGMVNETRQEIQRRSLKNLDIHIMDSESREEITDTLGAAGFDQIEIIQETHDFYYQDAEEWWATLWTHGYRAFLELMDEGTLAAYKKESLALVDQIKSPDGILETFQVFFTRAVRP